MQFIEGEPPISREMKALGYRKISARPRHHAQNEFAIEAYIGLSTLVLLATCAIKNYEKSGGLDRLLWFGLPIWSPRMFQCP